MTNNDGALDSLFHAWQWETDNGRDPTPAEICAARPDLVPALERRIAALRKMAELLVPMSDPTADTAVYGDPPAADESAPALPGYGPLEKIGHGGMGFVYKARNLALDRVEAIKTVRPGDFAGPRELARFQFEAEAAARLAHPNVVTVYGVGEAGGRPYLAMRWVDGTSLAARPPDPPRATAVLVAKVARAVHFAHEQGILHRDIKPGNILVDAAGEPFVADFGIARRLDPSATQTGQCNPVGTPAYMAPEQARCEPRLTVAADVWAVGAVLYERLTGRPPFGTDNPWAIFRRLQTETPTPPRELNPALDRDLEAVCMKCLEKDAADRYAGADELAADLERFARGEPVAARPPGFWDWVRQLARTRPEPHPHYSWPVTAWFGLVTLVVNGAVLGLIEAGGSAAAAWAVHVAAAAVLSLILWWYMLRRFRQLPPTERHSLIIGFGGIVGLVAVTIGYVPVSADAPARIILDTYPAQLVVAGFGTFVLGSTNWSRFFPIGLALIALVPFAVWYPQAGPYLYGVAAAALMWYWTYAKAVWFRGPVPG
ncbi:serine/threonine-protein kinase [Urbifossiella limnaea]|uniref:Serine/threonine-protein kinase PknB n=1 Tax=Urbifossiella limnaea TaxID=2528023 RepID=A0A517Y1A3_9BACT|nr:serine/threonine-protein kinase [Urbifossiella limnaea]QDU23513.1 Serine/threonine-protein kinase PknB [Urbifossiella limnaea]